MNRLWLLLGIASLCLPGMATAAPEAESASRSGGAGYGHPIVLLRAGVGMPNLLNVAVEGYVMRTLTLELGAGMGLLPASITGAVRWRPDGTCWRCDGRNSISLGFGLDGLVFLSEHEGLVAITPDATYMHRFSEHFGILLGARVGGGLAVGSAANSIEPGLLVQVQTGLVF